MAKKKNPIPDRPTADKPADPKARPRRPVEVSPQQPLTSAAERLKIGEIVAHGGMSVIRAARDMNLHREAVMKIPIAEEQNRDEVYGHLVEEAQITAQLDHPNIVPVHELGLMADGTPCFVMKWVRGCTLWELNDELANETPEKRIFDLLQIFLKVCDAVAFAHSRGVVNRDLKPENIMVGDFGEVYVMDWGIAKVLGSPQPSPGKTALRGNGYPLPDEDGRIIGTPSYLSPEQARGDNNAVDERTDVFGLGGILYWMICGEPLYIGDNPNNLVYQALQADIRPQEVRGAVAPSSWLCRIVSQATAKDPKNRFQSVADLKKDVESFLMRGWQFQTRNYQAGSPIICQGDVGHDVFRIIKGACVAYRTVGGKEVSVRTMVEGDVFGEIALFTNKPRTLSVRAASDVIVHVVDGAQLDADMGDSFWLKLCVGAMAERFRSLDGDLVRTSTDLADAEIAVNVLKYINAKGVDQPDGRREAKWSRLRDALCTFFDHSEDEIKALVERTGMFAVNPKRDAISGTGR